MHNDIFSPVPPPLTAESKDVFRAGPGDLQPLHRWLTAHNWHEVPVTSTPEFGRYRSGDALIISYRTGTLVCAGRAPHIAARFLRQAVIEQTTLFVAGGVCG